MTRAVLLAAGAGSVAVLAAWDLIGAVEHGGALLLRALRPLAAPATDVPSTTRGERRRLALLVASVLLGAGWLVGGATLGLLLAGAGPVAVRALLARRRRRWEAALLAAAPSVARSVADAIAGGHSVRGALVEAARGGGVTGPAGAELRAAAQALELGEGTELVLDRLRRRGRAPAYDTLVAAILVQRDAGGDLARLLRDLASSLEAAVRLERDARAATAQARFTGGLVAALPLGAVALAELAQPGYLGSLARFPLSAALLVAATVLQVAGLVAVRRLGRARR